MRLGPAIVAKVKTNGLKVMSVDEQFVGADGKFMENVHHLGISALCPVTFEELAGARNTPSRDCRIRLVP
jgi:hypothetical protein